MESQRACPKSRKADTRAGLLPPVQAAYTRPMLLPVFAAVLLNASAVTFQDGVLTPPLVGAPGTAALAFANSHRTELGLDGPSTLVVGKLFSTRFGGTVQLLQQVDGLQVHGGAVLVTFDAQQRVVRVSSSVRRFNSASTTPMLTGAQALSIATHEVNGAWLRADGVPYGGWKKQAFVVGGALHVGFLTFVPTLKNSDNWHVAVDGLDGAVLFVENRVRTARDAKVYASSPGGLSGGVGRTATIDTQLTHVPEDGGFLSGARLRALNCCPTFNCQRDAGPARATGQSQTFQGVVNFDVAICDQRQRATNDPAAHASGNYVYVPVDPPGTAAPDINQPADYDEFAEVHAYYHVSKAYEAVRALSLGPLARDGGFSPFTLRVAGPDNLAVWVNVSDPDFQNATPNGAGVYVSDTLARTDNAMFLARENMDSVLLPPQVLASDALVIYQGASVDFAYDGPVLWHEFGHGVIHSTSDWTTMVTIDSRSANNESSALDEAIADLIAVMVGKDPIVGQYVGPRIDPTTTAIRDVNNTARCPDDLWGESHQDSLHFTGAVWQARSQFLGLDQGATFDAALYAAIVSFPPNVNFVSAAQIITSAMVQAFPAVTDTRTKLEAAFHAHGVTGCSKILDVTNSLNRTRRYFNLPGAVFAEVTPGNPVPGPYQFKIHVPRGAKSLSVFGPYQTFGGGGVGTARLQLLASADMPITFARSGSRDLINDAQKFVVPTTSMDQMSGQVLIDVPCGGDLHFAIGNTSQRDRALFDLGYSFVEADSCPVVDAGTPPKPLLLVAVPGTLGSKAEGCGCTTGAPFMLVAALLWLRRRSRPLGG